MISKPPEETCPTPRSSGRDGWQHPICLFCAHPRHWGRLAMMGGESALRDNHCHSLFTRPAEISSKHECIFQAANGPLVISQGFCIPHRIPSIHATLLILRRRYFNSSVMSVVTRMQEETEYEVHFSK